MYRAHTVAVIVPAHDEAAFVGDVVGAVPASVDRVYVVDDASDDDTSDVALAAADPDHEPADSPDLRADASLADRVTETARRGRVVVLRHGENRGPGGAVVTGYLAALSGAADLVATVDGDGQMDLGQLHRFLDSLVDGDADYAKGTRLRRADHRDGMPSFRLFGNDLLTLLCRVTSGYWTVSDPVNGYTAITRDALRAIDPASVHEGYGYGTEILARLHANGGRVVDVAHESRYGDEESGIDLRRYAVGVSWLLVRTLAWRLSRKLPGAGSETSSNRGWES